MRTRTRARTRTGWRGATALAAAAVLTLAGCQADAEDTPPTDAPAEEAGEPDDDGAMDDDAATGDDGAAAADATVALGGTDLGEILVGPDGRTLYMFDPDAQGESTCYDECATSWPPLTLDDGEPTAGDGVDATLLGTTERTDGTTQVTYDGWPLYYWAQDAAPGDATGQAVNEVWWVLDASGEPIRD